jgi:hypothetical protein
VTSTTDNPDSGSESDGESALRDTAAHEQAQGARRGPENASMQHFHDPTPVLGKSGDKRWEFRCKYCTWYVAKSVVDNHLITIC